MYQDTQDSLPIGVPVGCKCDLIDKSVVSPDIAKALANDLNMQYIKTSTKQNSNCTEALEEFIKKAIELVKFQNNICLVRIKEFW